MQVCEAAGKRLIVGIVDRTFPSNTIEPLPAYMSAYSFPSISQLKSGGLQIGWGKTALRWHPKYVERFSALVNAIQTEFNGRAGFEGISIEESAHGFEPTNSDPPWRRSVVSSVPAASPNPNLYGAEAWYPYHSPTAYGPAGNPTGGDVPFLPWGAPDAVQYSATRYCNAYRDIMIATKATRTTSRFFLSINYIQGGQGSNGAMEIMFGQLATEEAVHVVIGGPDWFPSFSHWKGKQAGPSYGTPALGTPSAGICGVVLPRYKKAMSLGLKIYTFFQFIEHDTGPNGVGRTGGSSKTVASDFDPPTTPIEYSMQQMFDHATKIIGQRGTETPGSGNPYDVRPAYIFWNNTKPGQRVFNFATHDIPVINANPTWLGSGGTSWD